MKLCSDSEAATGIVHDPIQHNRMKHVRIDRNFIKSEIDSGSISLNYIPAKLQEAVVLIMALLKTIFDSNETQPGMIDIYSTAWGDVLERKKNPSFLVIQNNQNFCLGIYF